MATLILRAAEQELAEKLPDSLKDTYLIEEESLTSYERPTDLVVRMRLVASDSHPEVRDVVLGMLDTLQKGGEIQPDVLDAIPHESLPIVYFGMGALGLCALIEALIPSIETQEDLEGIAALTKVRHLLLESNEFVTA